MIKTKTFFCYHKAKIAYTAEQYHYHKNNGQVYRNSITTFFENFVFLIKSKIFNYSFKIIFHVLIVELFLVFCDSCRAYELHIRP